MPWRSALFVAGLVLGMTIQGWRLGAEIDEILREHAEQAQQSEALARQTERHWQNEMEKVRDDAKGKIDAASDDAAGARDAANRLRKQVAELSRRAAACPGVADGGEAAGSADDMLAVVFSRIDERAGEIAAYADRARIAGSACEVAYELIYDTRK